MKALSYYVERALARLLFRIFTRWHVKGKENIPARGPVILAANHIHAGDPPLLSLCTRRRIIFMAKEESFRSIVEGPLVRGFDAFPVKRWQMDRKAVRRAQQVLESEMILGMFPEGTRSSDGRMQQAYSGTAFVALRTRAPIIPIGITGTERIRKPLALLCRPKIMVNIGQPFQLPEIDGKFTRDKMVANTDLIMSRIAELLPESYRGVYSEEGRLGD